MDKVQNNNCTLLNNLSQHNSSFLQADPRNLISYPLVNDSQNNYRIFSTRKQLNKSYTFFHTKVQDIRPKPSKSFIAGP